MKKVLITTMSALVLLAVSCGDGGEKELSFQEQMELDSQESEKLAQQLDLDNVGVGPIQSYELTETIDAELAGKGKALFQEKCTACHKENEKVLGPPPVG
ncbi:MAG: c-type cytochrome, partial [Flavobacteriales bacterium]